MLRLQILLGLNSPFKLSIELSVSVQQVASQTNNLKNRLCVCVHAHIIVYTCSSLYGYTSACMGVHMEARGQSLVSFLEPSTLFLSEKVSHWDVGLSNWAKFAV